MFLEHYIYSSTSLPIFGISSSYTGKATVFLFKDLGLTGIIVAAIADVVCHIILARELLVLALGIVQAILSSMVKKPRKTAGTTSLSRL